ncbi:hypothetical protein L9F63_004749 [Diploptera punctata]|uniref:NADP-dependent oxidoreductase domain-containing protein n=1 Tax=Diploptera punctata TaxID=6984 RepID=A0AAD7ZFC5_DIPPU|nr:hypothetical protein L9F63_004749 [Diploptera punctata]
MTLQQAPSLTFSNGYSIPVIGLGTWKAKPGQVEHAVETAIDVGYRHIDCAFVYQNENEVGTGINNKIKEGVVTRGELFITTKLWNTYHRPELVISACKKSLEKLGLDYLDLFLIHWPFAFQEGCDLMPADESGNIILSDVDYMDTWREMEKCVDLGLVRSLGMSNFNSEQLQRVIDESRIKPVNLQCECNPYINQKKLRNFCKERNIVFTAYSPLGSSDSPFLKPGTPKLLDDPQLLEIGQRLGKSGAQIILRYLVQQDIVTIPKSVTASRISDNLNLFDFELTDEDITYIDSFDQNLRICHRDHAKDHKYYPFNIEF